MKSKINIALLRGPQFYKFSDCYFDTLERRLFKNSNRLEVTPRVLEVLQVLIENAGEVVSKDELLDQIWGESFVEEGNLAVQISKLRTVLGATKDEPYIVTESGIGYKFVSRVRALDDDEWADLIDNELAQREGGKQKYTSIAVMPLLNETGAEDVEYLADGLTESLINSLSRIPDLRVITRNTVFQFKDDEIDIKKLGRRLRVATILTGRLRLVRGNLAIAVELAKVADGSTIWGTNLNEPLDDIFAVQEKISSEISNLLIRRMVPDSATSEGSTPNAESYRMSLMGLYLVRQAQVEELNRARIFFSNAIGIDPTNVTAYVCDAYVVYLLFCLEELEYEAAIELIDRNFDIANILEPKNPQFLTYSAVCRLYLKYDFDGALKLLEEVIEIDESNLEALGYYAILLSLSGNEPATIKTIKRIKDVEPFSIKSNLDIGKSLYLLGRFDQARDRFNEIVEIEPNNFRALLMSATTLAELSHYDDALRRVESASKIQRTNEIISLEGYIFARNGDFKSARMRIDELTSTIKDSHIARSNLGIVYAALGEVDLALEYLQKAYEQRLPDLVGLRIDPHWKSLHGNSKFESIVGKIGIPISR